MADEEDLFKDLPSRPPTKSTKTVEAKASPTEEDLFSGLPINKDEPSAGQLITSGLVSSLGARTAGMPVDMAAGAANALYGSARSIGSAVAHPLDALGIGEGASESDMARQKEIVETPLIQHPWGGSEWWNKRLGEIGLPTTENVKPADPTNKFIQQAVLGAGTFLGPGLAGKAATVSGLPRTGAALMSLTPGMAEAKTVLGGLGAAGSNAGYGAVSGAAGEAAAEAFPESHSARGLAEMLAPVPFAAGAAGANAGARRVWDAVPPFTAAGREAVANRGAVDTFTREAGQPRDVLADRLAADENELATHRTSAEASENPGLASLQRTRQLLPSELQEGVRQQQIANINTRGNVVEGMMPETGTIEATRSAIQGHLDDLDATHAKTVAAMGEDAERMGAPLQPTMSPEEQGQAVTAAVDAERAPTAAALAAAENRASGWVEDTTGAFGGKEALGSTEERAAAPAQYGAQMRDPMQEAYLAERARLAQMHDAIDPTGTEGMNTDPVRAAVDEVRQNFHPDTFGGMENKFYNRVTDEWGDLVSLEDAARLRADINARLKNVPDHNPQEQLRLLTLKRGIDEAMTQAAERGGPGVGERLAALEKGQGIATNAGQDVAAAQVRSVGRDIPAGENAGDGSLRPSAVPPEAGASGTPGGGSRGGAGDQGVPAEVIPSVPRGTDSAPDVQGWAERTFGKEAADRALGPAAETKPELTPLTPEARARFAQWNRDYAEMARDYRDGAVGKMLEKEGAGFKVPDASVPGLFKTKADVEKFLEKASPESVAALDNHYAFSLRSAMKGERFNLAEYQKWLLKNEGPMSARPELLEKFNTAAKAQEQLNGITRSLTEFEQSHPLNAGWGYSGILPNFFKAGPRGHELMQRFAEMTGGRPEAMRAAEDYAAMLFVSKALKNGEVDPKLAANWVSQHREALRSMPELAGKIGDAASAQKLLQDTVAKHLDDRKLFTESVAGKFIQDDPSRAIGRVFTGTNRNQKAQLLVDLTAGNAAATEGLRRATLDYIKDNFQQVAVTGASAKGFSVAAFRKFVAQNGETLKIISPDMAKKLNALSADLERSQIVDRAKTNKAGSDTAELTARIGKLPAEGMTFRDAIALWLTDHIFSHVAGVVAGPAATVATAIGLKWLKGNSAAVRNLTDHFLDQMLLDPAVAIDKLRSVPAGTERTAIGERFRARLMQSAIQAARSEDLQPPKKTPAFATGGTVVTNPTALHREAKKADPVPSDAQKSAGNYQKAHIVVHGVPITIENAKGSFRCGTGNDGRSWAVRMPAAYGYVKRTEGMDGEHIDVYVGDDLKSDKVFIVDQVDADTKKPDEHKVMLGFANRGIALSNYRKAFSDGRGHHRIGGVTQMTIDGFKKWIDNGKTTMPLKRANGGGAASSEIDAAKHLAALADSFRAKEDIEVVDDGRADGGPADPWRTLPAAGQAAHLADTAARIRNEINAHAEAA